MGKERLEQTFSGLRARGESALMTYVTAGDPDMAMTEDLIRAMVRGGADIIELGVPFSDPLADGPTIQRAVVRSLRAGTSLAQVLRLVAEVKVEIPLVLLLYYNTILANGEGRFVQDAVAAGVDGIVVPDLPPEEGTDLREEAARLGLAVIPLVAPTTQPDRLSTLLSAGSGFVYYVSVRGVTGVRKSIPADLVTNVDRIRKASRLPVAVGFGVSTPEQAEQVASVADGVIVGSAIIETMERTMDESPAATAAAVERYVASLKDSVRRIAKKAATR